MSDVNKLCYYKKDICAIAKETKTHYFVNIGTSLQKKVAKSKVIFIDTSNCQEMKYSELKRLMLGNKLEEKVIIGNELKKFVGIGLITERVIKEADLKTYKRIVD